jgi:hypothetical protein
MWAVRGYVGIGTVTGEPMRFRDVIANGKVALDDHDVPD